MRKHRRTREQYFIQRAWHSYMKFQKKNIREIMVNDQYIANKKQFAEIYESSGHNLLAIKDKALYATDIQTFRQFQLAYKNATGQYLRPEARKMTTSELSELLQNDIEEMRSKMKQKGYSNKDIKMAVSQYFFGSK